jgi:Putative Ig domain
MLYDAFSSARNRQQSHRTKLLQFVALTTTLACFGILSACSVGSSASTPSTTSTQPNPSVRSLTLSGTLPAAEVGSSFNSTLNVSGGTAPYTFSISWGKLPGGLTLSTKSGTISGTPTEAGTFSFGVHATDSADEGGAQAYAITVSKATGVTLTLTPATTSVTSGATEQFTALVTGTSNVGVTWSASTGTISKTGLYQAPTITSNTTATVTATSSADSSKQGTASVTVTTTQAPSVNITTSSLPSATSGTAYSDALAATGGKAPYTWTVTFGSLPSGISLQSSGTVSGTSTQIGTFSLTFEVTDSSSPRETASKALNLTVSSSSGASAVPGPYYFGFSESDTNGGGWPGQSYGMQRFWDSPPMQWPSINTASGVFDFSSLDTDLALAYSKGAPDAMYTLARTPPWATSAPTDSSCNYTTGMGGGNGECDAPIDLNADGSGSNAIWKAWITAIAGHVNTASYLQSHAHIKYWEIWNEPDTKAFFAGTIAQLARMTEDANCIITGRGVIHESGNGTATQCTAVAIDPNAQIVMASAHAKGGALTYGQNELYCNKSPQTYQLPCPNPPNAIATAVDIINFHMKPGNETGNNCPAPTPCTPEAAMQMYVSNIRGMLQPAELTKPLWDGEAQYSMSGWSGDYLDGDMAASFMPRFYLVDWTLGITGIAWYSSSDKNEPVEAQTSYQQTYNWLSESSLTTPCAATGSVWSCGITNAGKPYLVMWDTSQTCANGSCSTKNQTVSSSWSQYRDMTTASTAISISGNSVPVGIKPVLLD